MILTNKLKNITKNTSSHLHQDFGIGRPHFQETINSKSLILRGSPTIDKYQILL